MHFNLELNIYCASASHAYPAIKRTQSLQLFVFSGLCSTLHGIICSRPALAATPTVTPPTSFIKIMHCMAALKLGWCCLRLPPSLPHPLLTFFLALFHWSLCGKAREAAFCQCRSFRYFIFMKVVKRQRGRERERRKKHVDKCPTLNCMRESMAMLPIAMTFACALGPTFAITSKCIAYCGASFMWVQQFAYAPKFPNALSQQ